MKQVLSVAFLLCLTITVNSQDKRITLLFAGDAMQHMPQVHAAWNGHEYDYDSCFYLIKDKVKQQGH